MNSKATYRAMIIKTSAKQDDAISEWYRPIVRAHHDEGCEPPGFLFMIELGHPGQIPIEGTVVCGSAQLDLGEVSVLW